MRRVQAAQEVRPAVLMRAGTPEEAAQVAGVLTEAARIAAEWAMEDTTVEIEQPRMR